MRKTKIMIVAIAMAFSMVALAAPAQAATGSQSGISNWFSGLWDSARSAADRVNSGSVTQNPAPPAVTAAPMSRLPVIIGLGDSIAAGDGLPLPAQPSSDEQLCRRSTGSYVDKLAASTGLQPINLACSGAGIWDGLQTDQEFKSGVGPTVKRESQITMAGQYQRPEVVTVSIGANSVAWYQWLAYCRYADCANGAEAKVFRELVLSPAEANLTVALARIQRSDPGTVILTGYYNPFAGDLSCLDTAGYSDAELTWISSNLDRLNETIERVSRNFTNTRYAAVDFGDRGLCSADPLVQGLSDPAPLHPTDAGQTIIAEAIRAQLP